LKPAKAAAAAADKAAADKAAATAAAAKAAADKAAADKAASEKAAAEKAAAAKAAADKAAADKAAAAELRRRAEALGLLQVLTIANIADDATLKKSIAFCNEHRVTSVSDMVKYNLVDDFVRHLGLRNVPGQKLRGMLQPSTARLAGHESERLALSSVAPPATLATSRFMESYNQPERRPDQLYALMTTDDH
jgi:hydroxypyruvate isomerase